MFDYAQLDALNAVVRTGSFERAAAALSVTPSAVSQRIRQLEDRLGTVLVIRSQPALATEAGQRLLRHVEEVGLLEHVLAADLKGLMPQQGPAKLRIAVNADSLATWFIDALAVTSGFLFELSTDDQDHSADWLKRGEVVAAVTAHPGPVQGCESIALGSLRYLATANPDFAALHFGQGVSEGALRSTPALTYDTKDRLQQRWAQTVTGKRLTLPSHMLPSTRGFVDATLAGLGWGMNPEPLVRQHLAAGRLVVLGPDASLEVPLCWQFSRVTKAALAPLTAAVRAAAKRHLV